MLFGWGLTPHSSSAQAPYFEAMRVWDGHGPRVLFQPHLGGALIPHNFLKLISYFKHRATGRSTQVNQNGRGASSFQLE